jgi:hypothetical protein
MILLRKLSLTFCSACSTGCWTPQTKGPPPLPLPFCLPLPLSARGSLPEAPSFLFGNQNPRINLLQVVLVYLSDISGIDQRYDQVLDIPGARDIF